MDLVCGWGLEGYCDKWHGSNISEVSTDDWTAGGKGLARKAKKMTQLYCWIFLSLFCEIAPFIVPVICYFFQSVPAVMLPGQTYHKEKNTTVPKLNSNQKARKACPFQSSGLALGEGNLVPLLWSCNTSCYKIKPVLKKSFHPIMQQKTKLAPFPPS